MNKKIIWGIVVVVVVVGGIIWSINKKAVVPIQKNTMMYSNEKYRFNFQYPSNLIDNGTDPFSSYLYRETKSDYMVVKRLTIPTSNQSNSAQINGFLQVSVSTSTWAVANCILRKDDADTTSNTESVTINGIQFKTYTGNSVGLSNRLSEVVYNTLKNNTCYEIRIIETGVAIATGPALDSQKDADQVKKYNLPFGANDVFTIMTPVVQSFTITSEKPSSQPDIKVIFPNGGENWKVGQTYSISTASEGELGARTIRLNRYSDDGVRVGEITIGTTESDNFSYKVLSVGTEKTRGNANRYKIQVFVNKYETGKGLADESDNFFTITK